MMHHKIIALIKREADNKGQKHEFLEYDTPVICRMMFLNYRKDKGLRLTNMGHEIMASLFSHYIINMEPEFRLLPKHILYLDRFMTFPYHYEKCQLSVYDPNMGVQLKLVDGNLDKLIQIKKSINEWAL